MTSETLYKLDRGEHIRPLWVTVEQVRQEVAGERADLAATVECCYRREEAGRFLSEAQACIDAIDRHSGDPKWSHATAPWLQDALHYGTMAAYARTGGYEGYRFQKTERS